MIDGLDINVTGEKAYIRFIVEAVEADTVFVFVVLDEFDRYAEIALIKWGTAVA